MTVSVPMTSPRVFVSWRRWLPSARIEKIWAPSGFVPNGLQLE